MVKTQADLNLAPSTHSSAPLPVIVLVFPQSWGWGLGGLQDVLRGEDAAKRSVGPVGRTSLTLPSPALQKCLTASPRTCGGASSPAAKTVSVSPAPSRSRTSLACPVPSLAWGRWTPLTAGRAAGHCQSTPESTAVPVRASV